MKGGVLDDFKLAYEALRSEPRRRLFKARKANRRSKNGSVEHNFYNGLVPALFFFLQQRKDISKSDILVNIDDRKNMSKLPQSNKKYSRNKKR